MSSKPRTRHLFVVALALTLSACDSSTGTLPAEPITVEGTVVDQRGYPLVGVAVFILGAAPVTTGPAGEFSIDGITPPYDVLLVSAETSTAALFVGLTRTDPYFDAMWSPTDDKEAMVNGTLVAGVDSPFVSPNPADTYTLVAAHADLGGGETASNPAGAASPFGFNIHWSREDTLGGNLHALQYTKVDGVAIDVLAYGTKPFYSITDGTSPDVGAITMETVEPAELAGMVEILGDFELANVRSGMNFADGYHFEPSTDESGEATFSHVVADVPGATGCVVATALTPGSTTTGVLATRTDLDLPTTDIVITVPDVELPMPISPGVGAGDVGSGSELVWTDVPDSVHLITFSPSSYAPGLPSITIFTTEDHATLPDLAPYGIDLPAATGYGWMVRSLVGLTSTDEVAVEGYIADINALRVDAIVAVGETRSVTTP